jgi:hypothetical protein
MAKLKPRPTTSARSRDPREADPLGGFAIVELLGDARPGTSDPAADRRWLAGRRWVYGQAAERFDPRAVLTMTAAEMLDWQAARLAWLVSR